MTPQAQVLDESDERPRYDRQEPQEPPAEDEAIDAEFTTEAEDGPTEPERPAAVQPDAPEPAPAAADVPRAVQLLAAFQDIAESHDWPESMRSALKRSAGIGRGEVTEEKAEKLLELAKARAKAGER